MNNNEVKQSYAALLYCAARCGLNPGKKSLQGFLKSCFEDYFDLVRKSPQSLPQAVREERRTIAKTITDELHNILKTDENRAHLDNVFNELI